MNSPCTLTLYADRRWISPYVFSVFVALREKGVPFSTCEVDLESCAQHGADFIELSLTARVPVLVHNEVALSESSAIVEYLDETFGHPPLFPAALVERARARQLMAWLRSDLLALRQERPTETLFFDAADAPLSAAAQRDATKLLRVVDAVLPPGSSTLFATWSMADADLAFMLQRLLRNGHPVPRPVRAFAETQQRRPSVAAFWNRSRS